MSHVEDRISEWLDEHLGAEERRSMADHLASCDECRAALEQTQAIVATAGALPLRHPGRDLWPAIRGQLQPRPAPRVTPLHGPRRVRLSVLQAMAASLVFAMMGGAGVWMALGGSPALPALTSAPPPVLVRAVSTADPTPELSAELAALEASLVAAEESLAPETVRVIRRNLEVIDRAIAEIRAALEADPADAYLKGHLEATERRKARYLREALTVRS